MRKILFACYGGFDFSMISPVLRLLGERGCDVAIMNRYDHAPSARQLKGLTVFQPPDVRRLLLSERGVEKALATMLDIRSIQHLIPLRRGRDRGLRYLPGWSDHYFDFAIETLHRYRPDLIVLSLGEAETRIIQRVCEALAEEYACLVPQRYEFKSIETFELHEGVTYMVAGEYGRTRLIRKGARPERVLVTGNPRFDHLVSAEAGRATPSGAPTILFPLQAVRGEDRLFHLLRRYVSSRNGVRLVLRPHPNLPLSSCLPFVRHTIVEPVSLAIRGTLGGLLRAADVLVTSWSLTVLEALIMHVPVITWKSDFLPDEMPFATRGDTLQAGTYGELEAALDRLLLDPESRADWIGRRRDSAVPYVGLMDGKATHRVADAMESLTDSHDFRRSG